MDNGFFSEKYNHKNHKFGRSAYIESLWGRLKCEIRCSYRNLTGGENIMEFILEAIFKMYTDCKGIPRCQAMKYVMQETFGNIFQASG